MSDALAAEVARLQGELERVKASKRREKKSAPTQRAAAVAVEAGLLLRTVEYDLLFLRYAQELAARGVDLETLNREALGE